ncbi:MAG: hypothetical protein ACP5M1_11385 [Acidiphilium sp.]
MSRAIVVDRANAVKAPERLPWPQAALAIMLFSAAAWMIIAGIFFLI